MNFLGKVRDAILRFGPVVASVVLGSTVLINLLPQSEAILGYIGQVLSAAGLFGVVADPAIQETVTVFSAAVLAVIGAGRKVVSLVREYFAGGTE